jgi:hypothetical protein
VAKARLKLKSRLVLRRRQRLRHTVPSRVIRARCGLARPVAAHAISRRSASPKCRMPAAHR